MQALSVPGGCTFEHLQATGLQRSATAVKTDSVLGTRLTKSEPTDAGTEATEICIQAGKNTSSEVGGTEPSGHRAPRWVLRSCTSRQELSLGRAAGCLLAVAQGQVALPRPRLSTPRCHWLRAHYLNRLVQGPKGTCGNGEN